jgi:hypothetical protein
MKKVAAVALLMVTLLVAWAAPGEADGRRFRHHRHGPRVFVGLGFSAFPYYYHPYPYWYYPPPYYVYSPPTVVVQEPPVYVQQPQQATVAPAPPAAPAEAYWYYCPSSKAYYPSVPTCPEPWVKVPPRQD